MNKQPENLLKQLYDITGLDWISWWPLAPGWWALIALVSLVAGIVYWRRRAWRLSWKGDAWRTLSAFEAGLSADNAQQTVANLSGLIRRIAMRRFSRTECAGLEGEDWLRWLHEKDPRRFDWERHGALMLEAPYAPDGLVIPPDTIKPLIVAAKTWVR